MMFPYVAAGPLAPKPDEDSLVCIECFRYENNKIYVVKSEITKANLYLYISGTKQDIPRKRVWCEIYVADGNKIRLYKIIIAKITPARSEQWEFKDFDPNDFKG